MAEKILKGKRMKPIYLFLSVDILEKLKILKHLKISTVSDIIREAIEEYIKNFEEKNGEIKSLVGASEGDNLKPREGQELHDEGVDNSRIEQVSSEFASEEGSSQEDSNVQQG